MCNTFWKLHKIHVSLNNTIYLGKFKETITKNLCITTWIKSKRKLALKIGMSFVKIIVMLLLKKLVNKNQTIYFNVSWIIKWIICSLQIEVVHSEKSDDVLSGNYINRA